MSCLVSDPESLFNFAKESVVLVGYRVVIVFFDCNYYLCGNRGRKELTTIVP